MINLIKYLHDDFDFVYTKRHGRSPVLDMNKNIFDDDDSKEQYDNIMNFELLCDKINDMNIHIA